MHKYFLYIFNHILLKNTVNHKNHQCVVGGRVRHHVEVEFWMMDGDDNRPANQHRAAITVIISVMNVQKITC